MGEVGTREWAARHGAGGSARSRRGAGVSRMRERERAGEVVRRKKSWPALCVATPIFSEVGAAMTGLFKVNSVGTLWLPGNDEVMAKEVGAVCLLYTSDAADEL